MSNSLQKHGIREVQKQVRWQVKHAGLDTVEVQVTRGASKLKIDFTGSAEQVTQARKILADWA